MSKFIWEKDDDVGITVTPPGEIADLEAEVAKVEAQLRAAGVTEKEEEALAAEPYGKEEK